VLSDPVWDVVGEPLVELVEVLRDDESVVPDISAISDREGVRFVGPISNRKIGKLERLIVETCGIALHGDTP
jgi:hypothetical protein